MNASLASFKKKVVVGTALKIENFGQNTIKVVKVVKVQSNGFYWGKPISKTHYWKLMYSLNGGACLYDGKKYYEIFFISWQKAKDCIVTESSVSFLGTPYKTSSGEVIPSPFVDISIGEPWLKLTIREDGFRSPNLTSFKKKVQVGTALKIENFARKTSQTVKVVRVQTNGFYWGEVIDKTGYLNLMSVTGGKGCYYDGKYYYKVSFIPWGARKSCNITDSSVTYLCDPEAMMANKERQVPYKGYPYLKPWLKLSLV